MARNLSPGELMRMYDSKFTMAEWWKLAEQAQHSWGKFGILAQFVTPGCLVFDVGANRGIMTLVFRQLGAQVVAVEPLFSAAPRLVREFAWKFGEDTDVIPVAAAISDREGVAQIGVHKNLPYLSSLDKQWMTKSAHAKMYGRPAMAQATVKTTTLDALIERHGVPDFIKIDVEGYEHIAIRGLSQPIKALSFEFHQDWLHSARQVLQHLDLLGKYEYNYALDNRGVFVFDEWLPARDGLTDHLQSTLTKKGKGSWGDIYARLA